MFYVPDASISRITSHGQTRIHLAHGGEQVPWAELNGEVVLGPPVEDTAMSELAWQVAPYWVVEAFNDEGEEVKLNPQDYARAVLFEEIGEG